MAHGEGDEFSHDIDPVFAVVTGVAATALLTPARGLHE